MLHLFAQSQYDVLLLAQNKANKTSGHMIMGLLAGSLAILTGLHSFHPGVQLYPNISWAKVPTSRHK